MCCSVLQCVAVCCSVLQCVAVKSRLLALLLAVEGRTLLLQCAVVYCDELQCVAVCRNEIDIACIAVSF